MVFQSAVRHSGMIVTVVTFRLSQPTTVGEMAQTFRAAAPKYQAVPSLLRKNYWRSEDGRRAGGIYVWATRTDADRLYTPEWRQLGRASTGPTP